MHRVLRSSYFWLPFAVSLVLSSVFFLWELGYLAQYLPSLPRIPATPADWLFMVMLGLALSFNAGLAVWQSQKGSCPMGVKSASGIAGIIGAITLICPACVLLPASLIGVGFFFAFIGPFLPLLRVIAIVLLVVSAAMLWPKQNKRHKS